MTKEKNENLSEIFLESFVTSLINNSAANTNEQNIIGFKKQETTQEAIPSAKEMIH